MGISSQSPQGDLWLLLAGISYTRGTADLVFMGELVMRRFTKAIHWQKEKHVRYIEMRA